MGIAKNIVILATLDTKGEEAGYLKVTIGNDLSFIVT